MEAPTHTKTIGMISGNGIYPETFAAAARKHVPGVRLVAAAFEGETKPELSDLVDTSGWFRVGQLGKMLKFFKKEGVKEAVMVGQIAPRNLFDLVPDMRTLVMIGKLKERNAESLFNAVGEEMAKDGITLLPATTYLDDLLPASGHVCGPALSEKRRDDVAFGFRIAKEVSRMDIGQTVVVKKGTVLAVEAFEGTNEAIKRGGKLGKGGAMLVKVSKPNQDFRFDVPVVGPETILTCAEAGVDAIVVEAKSTLLLGLDEIRALCKEKKVAIHAEAGQ